MLSDGSTALGETIFRFPSMKPCGTASLGAVSVRTKDVAAATRHLRYKDIIGSTQIVSLLLERIRLATPLRARFATILHGFSTAEQDARSHVQSKPIPQKDGRDSFSTIPPATNHTYGRLTRQAPRPCVAA